MSFDLKIGDTNNSKSIQLIDHDNHTVVTIHSKGALMNSWLVEHHHQLIELILGNQNHTQNNLPLDKALGFEMNGFRSGKMSPFSCRIDAGKYHWANQIYQFKKFYLGEHAMHGLIYDANFEILSTIINEGAAMVELGFEYQGTDPGFPFPYLIRIQWSLYPDSLISVKTTIHNRSSHAIPMMDGWHPYFTLGGYVDDYVLEFIAKGKLVMNETMIPSGLVIEDETFNTGKKIGDRHFDDCYQLPPSETMVRISYEGKSINVTPKHNYPYLQIYTPEDRKSIAIENLSGAPDCFNNKMGLQILEPQGQIYFETSYQFKGDSNK